MAFSSSPKWKPDKPGEDDSTWESQMWFEGAGTAGQPASTLPDAGLPMFQLDNVDGMFGPGAFEPQLHLASAPKGTIPYGALVGLHMRTDERETSSLLHILGSDLFHGALDGEGGHDTGAEGGGQGTSSRLVGRLDELNGSVYVAPVHADAVAGSVERKLVSGQAPPGGAGLPQGSIPGSGRGAGYAHGVGGDAQRRGYHASSHESQAAGHDAAARVPIGDHSKVPFVIPNGAHGHWMPEHGAQGNFRGSGRGQGPYGYGANGPKRGGHGHWHGPVQYGGPGGRGGSWNVNHVRGGGPEASGGGPMWKPGAPGAVAAGRADHRHQQHVAKGAGLRVPSHAMQPMQQQPYMNGRPESKQPPAVQPAKTVVAKEVDSNPELTVAAAGKDSGPPSGSSAGVTAETAQIEGGGVDSAVASSTTAESLAEKEAADKAKREAKKKNKKEKMRKSKEEGTPNSTPVQGTPVIDAVSAPEQPPPLSVLISPPQDEPIAVVSPKEPSPARSKESAAPEVSTVVAKEKNKGSAVSSKLSNAVQPHGGGGNGGDKSSKVVSGVTKKGKENASKKAQQHKQQQSQRKGRTAVCESEDEEEPVQGMSLRSMAQSLKQWVMPMWKPQQRRRGRSKAYRMWITMGLRALMLVLAMTAITSMLAPGAVRPDSSCRTLLDSVRNVCKDTFGVDCKPLATKVRWLCYVTESIPGMRLLEMLVLWVARLGRLSSVFTRNTNAANKGLIARCRLLPLQHHCSLGGPGHKDRLRWHLDTVLKLLQLEREGSFSNGLCVGEKYVKCGALSMSRWNSGIRRHTGAYSLLCEQQFGEGAEFDGEMCACRKGYSVRGGMCRKVARGIGKGGSDEGSVALLDGGSTSKRLGAAGAGSAAKCATRSKKKGGKARKLKDERGSIGGGGGGGGARRSGGARQLGGLQP